jgi:integrase
MAFVVKRKRSDGSVGYQVRWRQGGRWQSDIFDTERKALRFRLDVEDAGDQWPAGWVPGVGYVTATATTAERTAFRGFAEQYLNTRTAVSDYQMARYRSALKRLAEHFPTVEEIDDQAVATWVRWMLAAGRAPKTVANYHGLLSAVCAYAVRRGLLQRNPCEDTQLPKVTAYDEDGEPIACFLEPDEFELIAEAMCAAAAYDWRPKGGYGKRRPNSQVPTCGIGFREDRDLITLAVHTGLRWGEISALRVGDVQPDKRHLSVKRAWRRNGTGEWIIGPPKTAKSRRTMSLAPCLVELLGPYVDGRRADQYLFLNGNGDPIRQNAFYEYRWQPAVKLARERGLTKAPRFHDLRHTHVAWLIAGNTPLPKIQQRLGHESIQTTIDVYGGLLQHTDDEVDATVQVMFSRAGAVDRLSRAPQNAPTWRL